ncbi:isoprenylcysteine alpha-carbonyl methylesterase ICME-like [Achlya hypogyna]|uniref:Isoprenylcysteine alpha-carbonyl methylesterase ICME-like n=1 Tax=Achlya hypogyna TaxID=1202772 RepID=A0A1V9ZUR0_ACHHY|nr:isoprenylcysteine alpha-carbonyl methylesterase ICME-like [Achlya hypogyna]
MGPLPRQSPPRAAAQSPRRPLSPKLRETSPPPLLRRPSIETRSPKRRKSLASTASESTPRNQCALDLAEVSAEVWLITTLTAKLLWAFRVSFKWVAMFLKLLTFTFFLAPAFLRIFFFWLYDVRVHKNIRYGTQGRNLLDIYMVPEPKAKMPVVVFLSGGAWIIGYKAWGALMGRVLSSYGILVVTPDYRNFPQGILPDMMDDANVAIAYVFENIHLFGGDPDNITLIGQSAGAHIGALVLLESIERPEFATWKPSRLRNFIGISGPYNIQESIELFHEHGLDRRVLGRIMNNDILHHSPTDRVRQLPKQLAAALPTIHLFHGTADTTVNWKSTQLFARVLNKAGATVHVKYYADKTHTDPIIEDPIQGDDPLLNDVIGIIRTSSPPYSPKLSTTFRPPEKLCPNFLVHCARRVNPF